jgi:thiamine biosynthesis lipoprotein
MTSGRLPLIAPRSTVRPAGSDRGAISDYLCTPVAVLASFILIAACSPHRAETVTLTGLTMGTSFHLTVPAAAAGDTSLLPAIQDRLDALEDQMSTYRESSEISRFNQSREAGPFPVSAEFAEVVRRAAEVSELSGGALDITVAPLVRLWAADRAIVPSDAEVADALRHIGYRKVEVRAEGGAGALVKSDPGTQIDVSAVAKGYAVDEVTRLLDARGIGAYVVEIGGELRTRGTRPDGAPWKIGIEAPTPESRSVYTTVSMRDQAMATSGDYRNFFTAPDGRRYSHLIEPRTGRPVDHHLASVTVVAPDCTAADAWATALLVLGPDEGFAVAESQGLAVLFLVAEVHDGESDGEASFAARATAAFAALANPAS